MGANVQAVQTVGIINLECDPNWTPCQKEQARAKVAKLNQAAKSNPPGLARRSTVGRLRDLGNTWAAKFRKDFTKLATGAPQSKFGFTVGRDPSGDKDDFMSDCLHDEWEKAGKPGADKAPLNSASPDHIRDIQWGGHVQGPLVWLDSDVNEKLGRDMKAGGNNKISVASEFRIDCK